MAEKKPLVINLEKNDQHHQQLLAGTPQTHQMRSGRVYLKPQEACSEHSTNDNEEILVFLSGEGIAYAGQESLKVGEGKILYIPPNTRHSIKAGTKPLIYVYCVSQALQGKGVIG